MLDMDIVNSTIEELENADTTFSNCEKLASLYIIREYNKEPVKPVIDTLDLNVKKELSDILPSYKTYCQRKKDYQLNKVGEDIVLSSLKEVCREILEFVHTLYSSTDMPEERSIITEKLTYIEF